MHHYTITIAAQVAEDAEYPVIAGLQVALEVLSEEGLLALEAPLVLAQLACICPPGERHAGVYA